MIKYLDDFIVYQLAMGISEEIFEIVKDWDYFCKDTVGKQLVRAVEWGGQSDLATW